MLRQLRKHLIQHYRSGSPRRYETVSITVAGLQVELRGNEGVGSTCAAGDHHPLSQKYMRVRPNTIYIYHPHSLYFQRIRRNVTVSKRITAFLTMPIFILFFEKSVFSGWPLRTHKKLLGTPEKNTYINITKNPRNFPKNLKNTWSRSRLNLDKPPSLKNKKKNKNQNKNRGKKKKATNQNPFLLTFSFVCFYY